MVAEVAAGSEVVAVEGAGAAVQVVVVVEEEEVEVAAVVVVVEVVVVAAGREVAVEAAEPGRTEARIRR
jgi:hypothetical protein